MCVFLFVHDPPPPQHEIGKDSSLSINQLYVFSGFTSYGYFPATTTTVQAMPGKYTSHFFITWQFFLSSIYLSLYPGSPPAISTAHSFYESQGSRERDEMRESIYRQETQQVLYVLYTLLCFTLFKV